MSTFPHSHPRIFIVNDPTIGTETPAKLKPGQLGIFNAKTHTQPQTYSNDVYIALGSYYTVDTIGGVLNSLRQSKKTFTFNPQDITKVTKQSPIAAVNQILVVDSDSSTPSAVKFYKGKKVYNLRVEIVGDSVVRALGRYSYLTIPAVSSCTEECAQSCEGELEDPAFIYAQWVKYINSNPLTSSFIKAELLVNGTVTDADTYVPSTTPNTVAAGIRISVAYVDTVFGDCSFNPLDFYAVEPIKIRLSAVKSDKDASCSTDSVKIEWNDFESASINVKETQKVVYPQGLGETIAREYLLDRQYDNIPFSNCPRTREAEQDPIFKVLDRSAKYTVYMVEVVHKLKGLDSQNAYTDNRMLYKFAFKEGMNLLEFESLAMGISSQVGGLDELNKGK